MRCNTVLSLNVSKTAISAEISSEATTGDGFTRKPMAKFTIDVAGSIVLVAAQARFLP